MKRIIDNYYAKKGNVLRQEDIIDQNNQDDKYIYDEIEDMLVREKLITKDNDDNSIIEFRTVIFFRKICKR